MIGIEASSTLACGSIFRLPLHSLGYETELVVLDVSMMNFSLARIF
jgi:hypothetical protein